MPAATTSPQTHTAENGNVIWFIMVAIILLGGLTMLLTRTGSSVQQSGNVEQARLLSGQVLRYAQSIRATIDDMRLRGISENELSFTHDDDEDGDYDNPSCASTSCQIFDVNGGGITFRAPPARAHKGEGWIFTGDNNVGSAEKPVETTRGRSGNDLLMLLPHADESMCAQINRELNVGTPGTLPEDRSGIGTEPFKGTFLSTLTILEGDPKNLLDGHEAGCFKDTSSNPDVIYFYYVLLAR